MTLSAKGVTILLVVGFVLYFIWNEPASSGARIGDFLGGVGHLLVTFFDHFTEFISNLGGSDATPTTTTPTVTSVP